MKLAKQYEIDTYMTRHFSSDEIRAILEEISAGVKAIDVAQKYGITRTTIYSWKKKFRDMAPPDEGTSKNANLHVGNSGELQSRGGKTLEEQNRTLKRLLKILLKEQELID